MSEAWADFKRGMHWVNKMLPAVAVLLGIVSVLILTNILNRQHQANLEFCARSNDARVSSVHNLRGDVHTLKAELALWEAAEAATTPSARAQTPPAVARAFREDIAALRLGIEGKEHAVRTSIAAQAPVAIHPGSPVVNCSRAYP